MRYLPHTDEDIATMLQKVGMESLEDLFDTIPEDCRCKDSLDIPAPLTEWDLNTHMDALAASTAVSPEYKVFMGAGSYDHVLVKAYSYIRSMGANLKKASQLAVLNANYIKEKLKGIYHLPYDRPCMHECVFNDKFQQVHKVTTLDIAKRLMEYGYHPPTIYFPLVVQGAIMIEPTETECKEDIDGFIEAMKSIAEEAQQNPELLHAAPAITKVERLDETGAARNPCLTG